MQLIHCNSQAHRFTVRRRASMESWSNAIACASKNGTAAKRVRANSATPAEMSGWGANLFLCTWCSYPCTLRKRAMRAGVLAERDEKKAEIKCTKHTNCKRKRNSFVFWCRYYVKMFQHPKFVFSSLRFMAYRGAECGNCANTLSAGSDKDNAHEYTDKYKEDLNF